MLYCGLTQSTPNKPRSIARVQQKGTAKNESAADGVGGKGSGLISVPASPRSEGDVETLAASAPPHKFQQIVEAIDESIALVPPTFCKLVSARPLPPPCSCR